MDKGSLGPPVENLVMCGPVENPAMMWYSLDTGMVFSQIRLMHYLDL